MLSATASLVRAWVKAIDLDLGLVHQPCPRAGSQQVVDLVDAAIGDCGEESERASSAEHGRQQEDVAGLLRDRVEAARDHVPHGRGQLVGVGAEPGQLDQEVGIAPRPLVPTGDDLTRHRFAPHLGHERGGLVDRQPCEVRG